MVVNPGPGRTAAPAAPAGGMVRVAAAAPGAAALATEFEANMAMARELIAKAEATVARDEALDAEVAVRGRYAEALALMAKPDRASKDRAGEIMRDPEVYRLHQAETAGGQYRPTVKAAAPDVGEAAMVALAKRGDMAGLEAHFTGHPGSFDRYRELRVEGRLEPTAAERVELRQVRDAKPGG